jgi:formylglycine-generating enzyme required for sulfatase activity
MERTFLRTSQRVAWMMRGLALGAVMLATAVIAAVIILAATGQWNRLLYRPLPMEWVEIAAGAFTMGSTDEEIDRANSAFGAPGVSYDLTNEAPAHGVYLDAFRINRHEVTNREYLQCVRATVCNPPGNAAYDQPGLAGHPVTDVNWGEASAFCKWAGGNLPSEAQWEKAARGPSSSPPQFPWGDDPEATRANVDSTSVRPVGSYSPGGDSPYGVADMAGNVCEWAQDWYASDTYARSTEQVARNPIGPATGQQHVLRGGSFDNNWVMARSAFRTELRPGGSDRDVGFRCVRSMQR